MTENTDEGDNSTDNGCPVCDWDGEVSHTYDAHHNYYTHVILKDNEVFEGQTCSERRQPTQSTLTAIREFFERERSH